MVLADRRTGRCTPAGWCQPDLFPPAGTAPPRRPEVAPAPADGSGLLAPLGRPDVEVRRSPRRRRTVTAYRENDRVVVLVPARMSRREEEHWVAVMLDRLAARDRRDRPGDADLHRRAAELSARYLAGGARPRSVRWVANQRDRWGSCTPTDASIRLSVRLQGMPRWVIDYVLLHELAHLLEPGHGPRFWRLLAGYPQLDRARGYLEGAAAAALSPGG